MDGMTQRRDIFGVFGLVAISDLLSVTPKSLHCYKMNCPQSLCDECPQI